jgi:hypothetical protein
MTYGYPVKYLLLFVCWTIGFLVNANEFIRGPYIQSLSSQSATICWKSGGADSVLKFRYGLHLDSLWSEINVSAPDSNFQVPVTQLLSDAKYFYSIETENEILNKGADYFFKTSKAYGDTTGIRFWAMGDFGSGNALQRQVRDVFDSIHSIQPVDFWVWLGDNAYDSGKESEYHRFVFDSILGYGKLLRSMPFFGIPGNHDYYSVTATADLKIDIDRKSTV